MFSIVPESYIDLVQTASKVSGEIYIIACMDETEERGTAAEVAGRQLDLPFDQYQRYRIVADVIERLREDSRPLRILDVGGGEGTILKFLIGDEITILDQSEAEGVPGFVTGDATALPFEDEAYDYVVSVDVYEHIESEARGRYLSELRRTARRGVLLAAPFNSGAVRSAEHMANEFHRSVHLIDNVWLKEHVENGLPELDEARRFFEGHEDAVSVLPNGYIPHWLAMICLTFYSPKLEGESSNVFHYINAFYNEFMYELDNVEPCYRRLLVCLKESVNADLDGVTSTNPTPEHTAQSATLFGTLSATLPLATEMKQLNTRLAQYQRRIAQKDGMLMRREAQVNDLSRRLAERISVANTIQAQAEQRVARVQQTHNQLRQRTTDLERQNANLKRHRDRLEEQLKRVIASRAWRLLSIQHRLKSRIGRLLGRGDRES